MAITKEGLEALPGGEDSKSIDGYSSGDDLSDEADHASTMYRRQSERDDSQGEEGTDAIGTKETRDVSRIKIMSFFVLLASALGAGLAVYYSNGNEKARFQEQFQDDANRIMDSVGKNIDQTLGSLDTFAVTISSNARITKQNWPFVTVDNFPVKAAKTMELSNTITLTVLPIVTEDNRHEWERYTSANSSNVDWIDEALQVQSSWDAYPGGPLEDLQDWRDFVIPAVHNEFGDISEGTGIYLPTWQNFPVVSKDFLFNLNWWDPEYIPAMPVVVKRRTAVISEPYLIPTPDNPEENAVNQEWSEWLASYLPEGEEAFEPAVDIVYPIIDDVLNIDFRKREPDQDGKLVGLVTGTTYWRNFLRNVLPPGSVGVIVVIESSCADAFTYRIDGPRETYVGVGDLHNAKYDELGVHSDLLRLSDFSVGSSRYTGAPVDSEFCPYKLHVYPSDDNRDAYTSSNAMIFALSVAAIFLITALIFAVYNSFIEKRQRLILQSAVRNNAIVSSLFPHQVRERLFERQEEDEKEHHDHGRESSNPAIGNILPPPPLAESGSVVLEREKEALLNSKPIADLFLDCTVLFTDIVNFTAWSSVRSPVQVFLLLEQVYGGFDMIAKRRSVFKVETIGDSYVAVAGLPKKRPDHAETMARFANECRSRLNGVVKKLETILGPDTGELTMRFGLNSGPVTAGVLRGENCRFQLFGDTVNTAARMESTGYSNMIHVSEKTANILTERGKADWVSPRGESVFIKGKGDMKTFWLTMRDRKSADTASVASEVAIEMTTRLRQKLDERQNRLVAWNIQILQEQLRKVVAMRTKTTGKDHPKSSGKEMLKFVAASDDSTVLDEMKEIIQLPDAQSEPTCDWQTSELDKEVVQQLQAFVKAIAVMYRDNDFHSFEHASHVTQAVSKLLSRVVTPELADLDDMCYKRSQGKDQMHQYTHGIASDPLTHFACIFSALIHDVDHTGVPNATLVAEGTDLAGRYRNKSVAEQNSVDLAWIILEQPEYDDLRACIYQTQEELDRFRQLVVNSVMATDISDKELDAARKARWAKAFETENSGKINANDGDGQEKSSSLESSTDDKNRKATIVIEHIIQASDVSHTMQHWHVYIKWNEKLFHEMRKAFLAGRIQQDPADGDSWYNGEIGFFKFYIIPLAKKLKECGVFGVSSDEFLNYAEANLAEWERKGRNVVRGYMANCRNR